MDETPKESDKKLPEERRKSLWEKLVIEHYDITKKAISKHPKKFIKILLREGGGWVLTYLDRKDWFARRRVKRRNESGKTDAFDSY